MVDFYSLGALLYEMLVGLPPLYSNNREEMYFNIANMEPTYPDHLSKEAVQLLKGLLQKEPEKRLGLNHGIQDIKNSNFFKGLNWENLLKKDPKDAPIKLSLKTINFDSEYTSLEPRLSLIEQEKE